MKVCPFCGSIDTIGYHHWKYYLATAGDLAIVAASGLLGLKKSIPGTFKNLLDDCDKKERRKCLSCHKVF